jgi:hypothetical protein
MITHPALKRNVRGGGVLFVTGVTLSVSLMRANSVIKLFFLGNFCWMSAIAGLSQAEYPGPSEKG